VAAVERLNIVAHDKFQEIIDEANRGDSSIRLKQVILDAPSADDKKVRLLHAGASTLRITQQQPAPSRGGTCWCSMTRSPNQSGSLTFCASK
jgi:type III restriction enzyme